MAEPVEIVLLAKDQFSGVLGKAQEALAGIHPAAGIAVGALAAVGTALYKAAMDTVDYADEVRKMMQLTGESAEESSRVIQVMDDYKVSIGTLTAATRTLSRQGLSLNIETLAKLSDEYVKLRTGAEKTTFLLQNFGRAGLQMAEAMEQGGTAIRAASDAMDEHLILSKKEVDAAREYQRQVDNLNDTWQGFVTITGNQVIPYLNEILKRTNAAINETTIYENKLDRIAKQLFFTFGGQNLAVLGEFSNIIKTVGQQNNDVSVGVQNLADNYQALAQRLGMIPKPIDEIVQALDEVNSRNKEVLSTIGKMQSSEESYQKTKADLLQQNTELERKRAEEAARGLDADKTKLAEYSASMYENNVAIKANEDAHRQASTQIVYDLLQQKLAQDGLTDLELSYLLEKGAAWGIYSQTVVDQAKKAIAEANNLANAVNAIPTDKDINFHLKQFGELPTMGGGGNKKPIFEMRATGGPVNAGQTYVVGERGPELFTPGRNGAIIPNGAGVATSANISLNINVTGGIINDPAEVGRQMVPALRFALRQIGLAA